MARKNAEEILEAIEASANGAPKKSVSAEKLKALQLTLDKLVAALRAKGYAVSQVELN